MTVLTIPGRFPALNDITDAARENRFKAAAMKKEYTELVAWYAKAARIPHMEQIDVSVTWYEPNRKRDKDNIHAGIKFILDGLVQAGVLDNDGWKQIGDISHRVCLDKENPRIEVKMEEVRP